MTERVLKTNIFLPVLSIVLALTACGGGNGLIGGGQNAVVLKSITLTPSNPSIALSVSPAPPVVQQFVAIGNYSVGNPQDITKQVTWISADPTVATIDANGAATAVNSGRTIITAQFRDPSSGNLVQSNTVLTVVAQLTSIAVTPASAKIAHGTTQQFTATGNYNDGTTADVTSQVTWNSSHPATASVSASPGTQGLATGLAQGATSITATLGTLSGSPAALTVSNANLVSLAVTPASLTVPLATSQPLVATGTFDDGSKQDLSRNVSWTTVAIPSRVARVSAMGIVTGLGLGAETISATAPSSGISSSSNIAVDESSVKSVSVLPVNMVLFPGAISPIPLLANGTRQQMRAVATFKDGSSLDVTGVQGIDWSSTDTSVASIVPESGFLTTQGAGSTNVAAALGSKQGSTSLNVMDASLQSVVVGPNSAQVAQGGIQNVVAWGTFLAPDNLTFFQQDVSSAAMWSSDSNASVSFANGLQELATGLASGTANVSAQFTVPGGNPATGVAPLNITSGQLSTISLLPGSAAVPVDGSRQFRAAANFTDGSQSDLSLLASWGSADDAVTTVGPFGFASASGPGQTSVSASFVDPGSGTTITGSGSVLVNPAALARIDICAATVANPLANCPPLDPFPPPPNISFESQTQFAFVAIGTFTDGSRQDLTDAVWWSSANPGAATISNDPGIPGIATGIGRRGVATGGLLGGTAAITAAAGGISGSVNVTINPSTLQSLRITPADGIVALGIPQQCKVIGSFSDGNTQDVTATVQWSSLNPDVAFVNAGGVAYPTGQGLAPVAQNPSALVIGPTLITVTMANPSSSAVFPWPVGTVFQLHGLTAGTGDVSLLNDKPFTVLSATDPADGHQLCKPGQACNITFGVPSLAPAQGSYTITAGMGQASALLKAQMNVIVNSVLTQISGTTTLTVQ